MTTIAHALRRSSWAAWILLALSAAGVIWMINDNAPPFVLHSYTTNSPRPGEVLYVVGEVTRDRKRECSLVGTRHIFDGSGVKWEVLERSRLSAKAVRQIDEETPDRWLVALTIPSGATPGHAKFVTNLLYKCNPLQMQSLWPIEVVLTVDFIISPASSK